jgi:hypothetical protein
MKMQETDNYASLKNVLDQALAQASQGKGRERHASGEPYEQQKICQGGRRFGIGAPLFQAWKKIEEACRMATSEEFQDQKGKERAVAELLGAINYAAAAVIVLEEQLLN